MNYPQSKNLSYSPAIHDHLHYPDTALNFYLELLPCCVFKVLFTSPKPEQVSLGKHLSLPHYAPGVSVVSSVVYIKLRVMSSPQRELETQTSRGQMIF